MSPPTRVVISTESDASNYLEHIHAGRRKILRRAEKIPDDRMFLIWRGRHERRLSRRFADPSGAEHFAEDLVPLQAEAAGDDFLLDLGGAAEKP
jgi:hypothetical protein